MKWGCNGPIACQVRDLLGLNPHVYDVQRELIFKLTEENMILYSHTSPTHTDSQAHMSC
jgi:hypothetical protein